MKSQPGQSLRSKIAELQKELAAKNRELEIEAALEKVRFCALAMQQPDDMPDICRMICQQLELLGVNDIRNVQTAIIYTAKGIYINYEYYSLYNKTFITEVDYSHPIQAEFVEKMLKDGASMVLKLEGKELREWYEYQKTTNQFSDPYLAEASSLNYYWFSIGPVTLGISLYAPLTKHHLNLFKRFVEVFRLAYRRYKDVELAIAQAREAQIELALERVRARAMAMRDTSELLDAGQLLYDELSKLGVKSFASGYIIMDDDEKLGWSYMSNPNGTINPSSWGVPNQGSKPQELMFKAWKKREPYCIVELDHKETIEHETYIATESINFPITADELLAIIPKRVALHSFNFRQGYLLIVGEQRIAGELVDVVVRFAKVFELTYTRFNDLQKAEAQAREAQIESSLERVRSKAMAMRNSGDLSAAASTVFTELRNLGINPIRSGVGLLSNDTHKAKLYSNTSSSTAGHLSLIGEIDLSRHPVFERQYQSWLKQENYFVALGGNELSSYYKILSAGLNADLNISVKKQQKEYGHWFMFSEGCLYAWSDKEYTDVEIKILERFKNVIELTFKRYIELQKSEEQAREAVRQASLDRVRAEIASMRTTADLERITPLIWKELTILGVPFIRCGVFIMNEPQQQINSYLSTPDGKAIAAFQLHFNSDTGNGVNRAALRGWREKEVVSLHWTEEEFRNFSHSLVEQGELASEEGYLTEHPPTGLDLHFFPFLQGMLYAGNTEPLSDDDKDLVQSLADAFSTAYARYEDFNKLEAAKQQVDKTVTELKAAQTQLIQSEKMASLGELTAGIAHEIQNPLNFVNNFSEVNQEMIDELEEELKSGNIEEALAIAADIKQNEQKINHHGKRADGIVKGMLEHSRTNTGEKQLTDINVLCDEFLNLSFHGLRAKDKLFNAEMITHFDEKLPKVNVIPQDIGRIMLNLFNNAFYAVNKKQKTAGEAYKAEVSVSTSLENGQVVIKVKDNGVGIPDAIKEKIMQPFFTTKPTGEGTGLGLSLTYDMVVKGHGGTIELNTKENEFTEFIVSLPLN